MEYKQREYPMFSACGLNCGLCPRYQMDGASKCPGCSGKDFLKAHPTCGVLSCSQRKGLEYCFQCEEFPCKKYNGADQADSFISHLHQLRDMERAKRLGMDAYKLELDEKITLLEAQLAEYDDGRHKGLFCLAVNLLELEDVRGAVERLAREVKPGQPVKERAAIAAKLFQEMALLRGVSLKLRKKTK